MGQIVVNLHLDHLGIDHHEAEVLRGEPVEDAGDDGIDANALARASGARHEQVGHLGEVGDDGIAIDILSQTQGDFCLCVVPFVGLDQLAKSHFHLAQVGYLDADGVLARDWGEDIDALGPRGPCDVALEGGDLVHANSLGRVHFVPGDGRPAGDVARGDTDAELGKGFDDGGLDVLEFLGIGGLPTVLVQGVEEVDLRERVVFV